MTFEQWVEAVEKQESVVTCASECINKVIGDSKGANGLVPDSVRASHEYQDAKRVYDLAFMKLRALNAAASAEWKKKASKLRRKEKSKSSA